MQLGSSTFNAYVRNIQRHAEIRQAQLQLHGQPHERSRPMVANPYGHGIQDGSEVAPFGRTLAGEYSGK